MERLDNFGAKQKNIVSSRQIDHKYNMPISSNLKFIANDADPVSDFGETKSG